MGDSHGQGPLEHGLGAKPGQSRGPEPHQQLQPDLARTRQQQDGLKAQLQILGAEAEQLALDRIVGLKPQAVAGPEQMQGARVLVGQALTEGLEPQPGLGALAAVEVLGHEADVVVLADTRQKTGADPSGAGAQLLQPGLARARIQQGMVHLEPEPQGKGDVTGPVAAPGPALRQGGLQVLLERREDGGDGGGGLRQKTLAPEAAAVERHQQGNGPGAGWLQGSGVGLKVMLQGKAGEQGAGAVAAQSR